ncbi:MAG: biotin--[acetyl-CoA-carboxylase] ligase [Clostridiales bacterium]|nr:biotin--[acetyl-CoA-carboxylase] ligase [Clostridiales bacterium]
MSDWKNQLIRALSEAEGEYLNGAQLAGQLGCTRSAIWKKMNNLRKEGYPIEAVSNRGYRLACKSEQFLRQVRQFLFENGENTNVFNIHVTDVTESTNQITKKAGDEGAPENSVFVTLFQKEGRGRRGRSWVAAPGEGLCFSVLIRPQISADATGMISLLFGLCVFRAIRELYPIDIGIKWPNDIVSAVNGKKLCGILSETSYEDNRLNYAVIGCGVNVLQERFPGPLRETATSLLLEGVPSPSAPRTLAAILKHFSSMYPAFLSDISEFLCEYRRNCVTLGREVFIVGEKDRIGTALDINEKGELMIRCSDGSESVVSAGEVSIRGIAGYS